MKPQRHAAILDLVRAQRISSQEVLRERLAERGFEVAQATLSRDVRETNAQMQAVIAKASTGDGNVARILNDSTLYLRLNTVLARVDSLTQDLKKNPRKYFNLKIF